MRPRITRRCRSLWWAPPLALAALLLATACAPQPATEPAESPAEPSRGGTAVVATEKDITGFHPLFDGGERSAEVDRTRAAKRRRLHQLGQTTLVAFREVEDALAQELVSKGISVATLCPGGIQTPLWNDETNPYPGKVADIMKTRELVDLVDYILKQPSTTLFKRIVFFPNNEWH